MEIYNETQEINIDMQPEMADEFEKRASSMHLSADEYCALILSNWIRSSKEPVLAE